MVTNKTDRRTGYRPSQGSRRRKVLVVHRHERGNGSTILAVVPATAAGYKYAKSIKRTEERGADFMRCDVVEIEEVKS
jgi:hypothetical protein